jgi:hypothetical protein
MAYLFIADESWTPVASVGTVELIRWPATSIAPTLPTPRATGPTHKEASMEGLRRWFREWRYRRWEKRYVECYRDGTDRFDAWSTMLQGAERC